VVFSESLYERLLDIKRNTFQGVRISLSNMSPASSLLG
jgi:hypothetical protein